MSESDEPDDTESEVSAKKSPAKAIAIGVVVLLIVLVALYALMDRMAPSSSRGIVSAYVVQLAPRVSGDVIKVYVKDNAVVKAGAPLFSIDKRPFKLAVDQAKANLQSALQDIGASSASLAANRATVAKARTALDYARVQAARIEQLEAPGYASKSQGDQARAKVADAKAVLHSAQATLKSALAQLGPEGRNNPAIQAAEVKLELAQYDLASTTVTAPHFGVVTNVTLTQGQFIGAGNPAMTFINAEAAWVTVDLRENELPDVQAGDPADLLFDALPGKIFEGRVQSIAWGINPGVNEQGGLVVNQADSSWFEPARRIPVRITLKGGMKDWPRGVRVGGKVNAVVFANGERNPIAWIAMGLQRLRAWASYLY